MPQIKANNDRYATLPEMQSAFLHTAEALCREVESWQPNLLVCLMHSAWMVVRVAEQLWRGTRATEFPPVVQTNIGREKIEIYLQDQPSYIMAFHTFFFDDDNRGRIGAWLEQQPRWRDELRAQVSQTCGGSFVPRRLLIVDEFVSLGFSSSLALCLASQAFPHTVIKFAGGRLDEWCQAMYRAWLSEFHPEILKLIPDNNTCSDPRQPLEDQITLIVPGTEDTDPGSLYWQPIQPDSKLLQPLLRLSPAEEWLRMPPWVNQSLLLGVDAYLQGEALVEIPQPENGWLKTSELSPQALILREAHAGRSLTSQDVACLTGLSVAAARRLLKKMCERDRLTYQGEGSARRYMIAHRPYKVTMAGPKKLTPRQSLDAFWLVPGRLLVSRASFSQTDTLGGGLQWLVRECQVSRLVFLDGPEETYLDGLRKKLSGNCRRGGAVPEIAVLNTPFSKEFDGCLPMLSAVEQALAQGEIMFVLETYQDRAEFLAGLYLIRQGQTAAQAMRTLEQLSVGLPSEGLPCPSEARQRDLLKRYAKQLKQEK